MRMELIHRNPCVASFTTSFETTRGRDPGHTVQAALNLARVSSHPPSRLHSPDTLHGPSSRRGPGLLWECVDLELGRIFVEGSLVGSVDPGLILEPPKTHSGRRAVDLDRTTNEVMGDHLTAQNVVGESLGDAYQDAGRVFAGPTRGISTRCR